MEKTEIYLELEKGELGLDRLTHLCIEVYYDKGGWSCLTGESHERAVCCRVRPVNITYIDLPNGGKSKVYGNIYDGNIRHTGFYVPVFPCNAKPPKRMAKLFAAIAPCAERIKDLFVASCYEDVAALIKGVGKGI